MGVLSALLDRALQEAGFAKAASYVGGGPGDLSLLALANRSASALRQLPLTKHAKTSGTVTLTASLTYALPADFYAYVADTAYIASNGNPVMWPTEPALWAELKSGTTPSTAVLHVRVLDGSLNVHNPQSGWVVNFEYYSKYPIAVTATPTVPAKELFTVDTDVWLLDDELFVLDVKWRYRKLKGLAWAEDLQEFVGYKNRLIGRQRGARTIGPNTGGDRPCEPYTNLYRT